MQRLGGGASGHEGKDLDLGSNEVQGCTFFRVERSDGVIAALRIDVWLDLLDELRDARLRKNTHRIHTAQSLQDFGTVLFHIDGA